MKIISNIFLVLILLSSLLSCGKDNYDAPESTLRGKIVYNGETLNLRGTDGAIQLQLYQDGYEKHDPIAVYVGQDGTFTTKLFNGEYKLITRDKNGPWVNHRDTIAVHLKGSTDIEVKVDPYYVISNTNLMVSPTTYNASFTIKQVESSANISKVMVILSKTQFVDDVNNVLRKDFNGITPGAQNFSVDISGNGSVANAKALFARVGVLANGSDQAIYSEVIRIR